MSEYTYTPANLMCSFGKTLTMAISKPTTEQQVNQYITELDPAARTIVSTIRTMVLAVAPAIAAQIKWNSLSFYYTGAMQAFDPKTYQSDILVCNLHRGKILLVFPTGAKVKDNLNGKDYSDGRKIITFNNLEEIKENEKEIKQLIVDWLKLIV